ncbi:MAG: acyl-phosphate glycerol 3-phosphate acyltransferase [Chloroflexi bacterium HGW-Chloroflexi-10]|nr:MAG: acyl-phosphate glycerol 3-phosphate acyltransferase [Chloroflexi bacterium HGW-Chloroflexi-10]
MNAALLGYAVGFGLLGYLSGSLPFAVWITRLVKGVDVRDSGSGHATTTNTIRQAGFLPGVVVLILDVAKGFLPAWLALTFAPAVWIVPIAAVLAVVGHCWPVFAGFQGGMGLATAAGAMLAVAPLAVAICLGFLIVLLLILHHSARATVIAGVLFSPLLWLAGFRGQVIWIALGAGLVITSRFLLDWNRQYRELWLDREKSNLTVDE